VSACHLYKMGAILLRRYGLGRRCRAGLGGAIGVRLLGWRLGKDVITSGCSLDFSVRSINDIKSLRATDTIGAEYTLIAWALQTGQVAVSEA
jgi:hypothetical protein